MRALPIWMNARGFVSRSKIERLTFPSDKQSLIVVQDDAHKIEAYLDAETVDFLVTSPPYWVIHRRPQTADYKNPRPYSDNISQDLGSIERYVDFLE